MASSTIDQLWPALPQSEWADTCATLQLWMQVVGKIRLALTPKINHTWNVTLYPKIRGVTTSPMWCGSRGLEIEFDFIAHKLRVAIDSGDEQTMPLERMSVAQFYRGVMAALERVGAPVRIWPQPCEVPDPIPFEKDEVHSSYDPEYAQRFWRVLLQTTRVFTTFRSRFRGKVSPVHLFWGAMDLACTRFSGRTAPEHKSMPGLPDRVTHDAYSHEVSSCGFWPGGLGMEAMFYSYAYPEPAGFSEYRIRPETAGYNKDLGEFVLPYEAMRTSADPDGALLEFLETTYEAAANCARWDRAALEVPAQK